MLTTPRGRHGLLCLALLVSGCHSSRYARPVIWTDAPDVSGQQLSGDFAFSFSTAEECEGLTLQAQGVPKTPRWVLTFPADNGGPRDVAAPVTWSLAHAEDPSISFRKTSNSVDGSVRDVCALVKQQGRR